MEYRPGRFTSWHILKTVPGKNTSSECIHFHKALLYTKLNVHAMVDERNNVLLLTNRAFENLHICRAFFVRPVLGYVEHD